MKFGDARYKLPLEIQDKLQDYWGRQLPANFKTPPYVTAEPVITTTVLTPSDMKDAFVVMGTDGLWEKLTNEEVVGLMGKWIEKRNGTQKTSWFGKGTDDLNVVETQDYSGAKRPGKRANKWVWEDGNAATHLIRNALGGGNLDEVHISEAKMELTMARFVGLCHCLPRCRDIIGTILLLLLFYLGI